MLEAVHQNSHPHDAEAERAHDMTEPLPPHPRKRGFEERVGSRGVLLAVEKMEMTRCRPVVLVVGDIVERPESPEPSGRRGDR